MICMVLFNSGYKLILWLPLPIIGHVINFYYDRFGLLGLVALTRYHSRGRLWIRQISLRAQSLTVWAPAFQRNLTLTQLLKTQALTGAGSRLLGSNSAPIWSPLCMTLSKSLDHSEFTFLIR